MNAATAKYQNVTMLTRMICEGVFQRDSLKMDRPPTPDECQELADVLATHHGAQTARRHVDLLLAKAAQLSSGEAPRAMGDLLLSLLLSARELHHPAILPNPENE